MKYKNNKWDYLCDMVKDKDFAERVNYLRRYIY